MIDGCAPDLIKRRVGVRYVGVLLGQHGLPMTAGCGGGGVVGGRLPGESPVLVPRALRRRSSARPPVEQRAEHAAHAPQTTTPLADDGSLLAVRSITCDELKEPCCCDRDAARRRKPAGRRANRRHGRNRRSWIG